jgi:CRP/FNR family transcriptional regulator, cyclic AMP receptor protein
VDFPRNEYAGILSERMTVRFEGDRRPELIDVLKRQEFVNGNADLASAIAERGDLVEFGKGDHIIIKDAKDDHVFLLAAGPVAIVGKGNEVATRKAGQHIGEMAAVEPAQKEGRCGCRTRHYCSRAIEQIQFPGDRRAIPSDMVANRSRALEALIRAKQNWYLLRTSIPKLFVMSSTAALDTARAIQALERDVFSAVWNE